MPAQDTTGWILACVSGLACVAGSSIICLDLLCRQVPRWKHFSIRESTTFLSASLSLSFGVMFFSALYGMLPKAHEYLLAGGLSPSRAAYALIGCYLSGVGGLQLVSELLHHLLPSSIVSCDEHAGKKDGESTSHSHSHSHSHSDSHSHSHSHSHSTEDALESGHHPTETSPLLPPLPRRPSIKQKISGTVTTLVKISRCNSDGPCYGFTDHVCEQKCDPVKILEILDEEQEPARIALTGSSSREELHPNGGVNAEVGRVGSVDNHGHAHSHAHSHGPDPAGHHHVAKNKFLSIGVQTSIAIALHKIPEGFITYATNHANPQLGFSVFLAIFIHNIAEGFIMSLPLFLALKSRLWAIVWASLLGGLAQPLGAGLAALTMRPGGSGEEEGGRGYGVLFAITAGIMCSVGLQLFSQAVQLKHGSKVPFVCGFVGMGLLGVSFALTA